MKKPLCFLILFITSIGVAQDVLMQNGTFNRCAPDKFYDSGGEFGNYSDDENFVTTICPQNTDEFIILNFNLFTTQAGADPDTMTIYDGDDTTAPLIGSYFGSNGPTVIAASQSNSSGCLTIEFISNNSGNLNGWDADIRCATACQDIVASIDTTTPEISGSGVISILPGESVDFSGSATFSVDGTDASYNWNFGDSNSATGTDVSNTFINAGTYTVTLTVQDTNPQVCADTATVTVFVLGPDVVVDQVSFTPEQLITDVLINSPCASVSNVIASTGINVNSGEPNGIGYFFGDGQSFPFEEGLILSSGRADIAAGPNSQIGESSGTTAWPGDSDLDAVAGTVTTNATFIQFDFTPLADNISFEFLMASEEYDMATFECTFSDAFAFLLTDSMGNTTNLAVLPGTNTPILVTNIHPFNGFCPAVNEEFFGEYIPSGASPIGYDGRTTVFTAQANVVPGENYTIKLVVGDDGNGFADTALDTGVFLKAGSFDLGGDLGDDITIAAGTAECNGTPITLDTGIPTANHVWYFEGNEIPGETSSILSVNESGTYSVDIVFAGVCQTTDSIFVEFRANPAIGSAQDLFGCGVGIAEFDLSQNDDDIIGSQNPADFVVTYHLTELEAIGNVGALPTNYTSVTSPQVIWARMADNSQNCFDITSFTITASTQPAISPVPDVVLCDDDSNDGVANFDLTLQSLGILGAQSSTEYVVSYHTSSADANAGVGALPDLYTNSVSPEPIFVRVERVGDSNCYVASSVPEFNLIVNPIPTVVGITPYALCDETLPGDGQEVFDLTTKTSEIIDGQANVTVAYYETQSDADLGIGEITAPYTNALGNPQPIVAVLTNSLTGCSTSTSFDLVVNPLPVVVDPTPLGVCDDGTPDGLTEIDLSLKNDEITGSNPNYQVSYYETLAEAETGTGPLPTLYTNTSNGQIIFVRVEDTGTGCYDTTSLELIVEQAPIAFTPTPLRYCDPDNDGFGIFTLTDADNEITGGAPGLTVSYHETEVNANNGVDAVDTSVDYNNIVVNTQTLYARVESATITTNCATIVELVLIVEPTPQLIEPSPLEECDDASADGFAQFDLTASAVEILNGQDPLQYLISYYENEADATTATGEIGNPVAYTNTQAFNQILWVRVDDTNTVEGCFKLTTLELIVNPLPVLVQPSPLELCDVDNPGDEQEPFTLEDANTEILNGQTGISLSYYETQGDADTASNPIVSPYLNTSNAQTVYVRGENDVTGCYSTVTLTLRVDPVPSPEPNPTAIAVCDDDNDGFAEFDLSIRTVEITNGEPDVEISYHETQDEAEQGDNPITGLYTNIVANTQTIYVRSENTVTGCFSLTQNTLELIVVPSPEVPGAIEPYVLCDDDADGITQFDLTAKDAEILGTQDPAGLVLSYHTSAADASTGTDPIINTISYTNTSNPQVLYIRLFDPATGCQDTGEFELVVELPPTAVQPTPLEVCDDLGEVPGDESTSFDLTVKDQEITGGNASWSVAYYETDADAQSQTGVIPDPTQYTNTSVAGLPQNPQTLYVVVTDTDTGCVDFTTMTIRVLPNPTPTPSDALPDLELCDEVNVGDGEEVFDLTQNEILLLNGEVGVTASYHETLNDADAGENAIVDPVQYTNEGTPEQEIYVRVTNDITGCYALVDFTIRVNPLPSVVAVTDLIQCELNTDGLDNFDLTSKDTEVLDGQDPGQFIVTYHDALLDAQSGTNALVSPYTNTSNPQEIYVRITNTITGCSISTQRFNLQVDEAAEANPNLEPILYELCDDTMETDGDPSNDSVQFDLSTLDGEVLDGQDPASYIVTYFASETDANQNVNPLPTLYENQFNPQVIYARVDNNTFTVTPIALDLTALTTGLDLNADGTVDTFDTDGDGVFDLVDVDGDGLSDAVDSNADGIIDFIDIDGDGQADAVDLNNDGTLDNQQDGSVCFAVADLTLQVNRLPMFDLEDQYVLCINTNGTEAFGPPVIATGLPAAFYSFVWSYEGAVLPGETGPSLEPTQAGSYSVEVTDTASSGQTNCISTDSTVVIESEPPVLTAEVVTQLFGENNVIEAEATGIGEYEYSLDGGPWQEDRIFTGVSPGIRVITARDRFGCGEVSVDVLVVDYPLYFTPNGDGFNETWNITGVGSDAKIYIFDRYGKLIKQLSPDGTGWDGTYNGNSMPTSDYWFMLEYIEPLTGERKEFKAHFTLKR